MRCKICDATLHDTEIKWNPELGEWEVCGKCLEIIEEVFEPLSEEETREQIEREEE